MKQVRITIGDKSYICDVFSTEEDRKKGLMNVDYLPVDRGALFVFEEEGTYEFWMKNTPLHLTQIAINDDEEVVEVYQAIPNDDTLIPFKNCKYLLEVNRTNEIKVGDDFDIDDEDELDKYVMKILAPDGSTQMFLQGGERIFSRKSTKKLIKQAKKANSIRDNEDLFKKACKKLGKICFKELYAQDHREQEYVKVPDK